MSADNAKALKELDYLRKRLIDMVNGDPYVDVGTLLYMLNLTIEDMGGTKIPLSREQIGPMFFERRDD